MSINDVLSLTLDLSANTDKLARDLQGAASGLNLDFDTRPLLAQFGKAQKGIQKMLSDSVAAAAKAGFDRVKVDSIAKRLKPLYDEWGEQSKALFTAQANSQAKANDEGLKKLMEGEQKKLHELKKRIDIEKKAAGTLIKRHQKHVEEAARLSSRSSGEATREAAEAGQSFGEGIQNAFNKAKSGDFGGMLSGIGKGASKSGASMQKAAGAAEVSGGATGMSKMMGKMGGMLTKMGPYIAAIGAVVAGIAALVAVVVAADSAMKDLNKTFMQAGVSGADLANEYGMLGDTLDNIRGTFTNAFAFNQIWGTTAKDHLEILGAYATAGVTFKEMTQGVKDAGDEMERLKSYTVAALTYSKLLGLSTQEVSTTMGSYMEELGLTLEGVQQRFSNITSVAKDSGFATKRFFNMILQATSGMSMYNVRLEEAAGLLIQLGGILGEKMGGDFMGGLMKGFKDESTSDRIKKTLTTGLGYSLKILQQDAGKSADEFSRKLEELGKSNAKARDGVNQALASVGAQGLSGKDLARKLSTLSSADRAEMLASAGASDPEMGRMLRDLAGSSDAFKGGLGGAASARQGAGGGASLLLKLNEARSVLHGKRIDEISSTDLPGMLAAEGITGTQGEELTKLRAVGEDFRGRQGLMSKAQGRMEAAGIGTDEANAIAAAFNEQFEHQGITLTMEGERQTETGEIIGDTFDALVMAVGEVPRAAVDEDIALAKEIAAATTDMAKLMEQGVEYFLEKIYYSVSSIANVLTGKGLSDEEKKRKGAEIMKMEDEIQKTRDQLKAQNAKAARLKADGDLTGAAGATAVAEKLVVRMRMEEKALRGVQRNEKGGGWFGRDKTGADFRKAGRADALTLAEEAATPAMKSRANAARKAAVEEAHREKLQPGPGFTKVPYNRVDTGKDAFKKKGEAAYAASLFSNTGLTKSLEDMTGADFIDTQRAEDERAKKILEKEGNQLDTNARQIIEGFQEIEEGAAYDRISAAITGSGVIADEDTLNSWVRQLQAGSMPTGLQEQLGGNEKLAAVLMGSGDVSAGIRTQIGPQANDFVMQIGASGKVKYAQRVHPGDETTTVSSRPGGGLDRGGSGGGGGVTIIQHNYTDMESIKKGWKALAAAKAL